MTAAWQAAELPFLKQLATDQGIELRVIDVATQGAPAEVGITPLIAFQNHRGRSIYQGRLSNRTRIANFLRTSRVVPQSAEAWIRTGLAIWQCERAKIAAPIKLTELAGTQPADFDAATFDEESRRSILSGFSRLRSAESVRFECSDRTFYFDFYPFRDESGKFYLSVALFSQFHCKEAIFESAEALAGTWDDRAAVFKRAASVLENETLRLMQESTIGDSFDCVPKATPAKSWEALGLARPSAPSGVSTGASVPQLAQEWRVAEANEETPPRVLFRFPAPLDGTSGEAREVSGLLQLGEGAALKGAHGKLIVDTSSVTLGVADLDQIVKSVVMLDVKHHPEATFTFGKVLSQEGALEFGRQTRTTIEGTFEMKGESTSIELSALWEPIIHRTGEARLLVDGAFSIRLLEPFGIKGPDGPSPERDTLLFHFALELEPK